MFNGTKYAHAVLVVLNGMKQRGVICRETEKEMGAISIYGVNRAYGVSLIKTGAARDKYSAAAAVFARLYSACKQNPRKDVGIEPFDWQRASLDSLKLSDTSLNDITALFVFDELTDAIK